MKKLYIILFFAVLIIIAGFLFLQPRVQAQTSSAVSGTAEIVNMGYKIYFSGSNGGTSGNIPYNVQYDTSAGKMTGYAWSPEYGWIQFTGSSAIALSFVGANDTETPTDWANGQISLSSPNYRVAFDPVTGFAVGKGVDSNPNHWAWGGNVIGWIDFSGVSIAPINLNNGVCATSHYHCTQGTSVNNVDGANAWTWNCNGINGGTNASCSELKNLNNGVCSATHYICIQGASANNVDGANAWTWNCNGINGGTNASCSEFKDPDYCLTNPTDLQCICAANPTLPECFDFCVQNPQICSLYCVTHPTECAPLCEANPQICISSKIPHYIEH